MFCLNLCEFFSLDWITNNIYEKLLQFFSSSNRQVERIYLGSSFCSQYFLSFSGYKQLLSACSDRNIPVTLVIPVISEKDIVYGKKRILELLSYETGIIDEITVNDIGMLNWINNQTIPVRLNLGRLFFKDPRDCRVPKHFQESISPVALSNLQNPYWLQYDITGIELDPTNQIIDTHCLNNTKIQVGLHMPYCYMTTGNICKFASIHKDVPHKYRPNTSCAMECMHIADNYSGHITPTNCDPNIYRFGRTLYFKANLVQFIGKESARIIYFPIDEWRAIKNEDINTIK